MKKCHEKIERLQRVIDRLLNGEPEVRTCNDEGVDYAWFRRFMQQNIGETTGPIDCGIMLNQDE